MTERRQKGSIATTLASATCALLGTTSVTPVQAQEEHDWDFDTALLYYKEDNSRVQDISFNTIVRRNFVDDRYLTLTLGVDTLTGATPIGAVPFSGPQTFTSPSGLQTRTTPPDEIPLDDSFLDTRVSLSGSWTQPLGRLNTISAGVSASNEYDYLHLGANVKLSRDFNNRNTTVSVGLAYSADEWDPVGGTPMPLTPMLDVDDLSNRLGKQDKDVLDVVLGVSQVVNRNLVMQLNYSYSSSDGYLNCLLYTSDAADDLLQV